MRCYKCIVVGKIKILVGALLAVTLLVFIVKGTATETSAETVKISEKEMVINKEAVKLYKAKKDQLRRALQAYFKQAVVSGDIVGAGISIVKGDSILIADGFGKRNVTEKAKVDGETIFRLGSLSKGFAGVLAANLQAEGKFDWNDRVIDYIPEFKLGDSLNTNKVKIGHILSHSSGTAYHSFTNLVEANIPVARIAGRFHEVIPQSAPGIQYSYQNAMFALIQEIMLNTTGKDVKTSLQNRFFTPLKMHTVSMNHDDLIASKNVAMPHVRSGKGWRSRPLKNKYYNAVVAGGINASSLDMAKWMRFLLGHRPEVAKSKTIKKAFEPFIQIDYNNKYYQRWPEHKQSHYGLGWRIHTLQKNDSAATRTMWHHGGSVNNYRNEIAVYPDADLGICVLLNGNSRLAQTVIPDVRAIVSDIYEN